MSQKWLFALFFLLSLASASPIWNISGDFRGVHVANNEIIAVKSDGSIYAFYQNGTLAWARLDVTQAGQPLIHASNNTIVFADRSFSAVRLYDFNSALKGFFGVGSAVYAVRAASGLAVAAANRTVYLFDTSGTQRWTFTAPDKVQAVDISSGGVAVAYGSSGSSVNGGSFLNLAGVEQWNYRTGNTTNFPNDVLITSTGLVLFGETSGVRSLQSSNGAVSFNLPLGNSSRLVEGTYFAALVGGNVTAFTSSGSSWSKSFSLSTSPNKVLSASGYAVVAASSSSIGVFSQFGNIKANITGLGSVYSADATSNILYIASENGLFAESYEIFDLAVGANCTSSLQCVSTFCVHGVCRAASTYCGDTFCDTGENVTTCSSDCKLAVGANCTASADCTSTFCIHGICRSNSTYCGDTFCDSPENFTTCNADCKLAAGANCTASTDCSSSFCIHGVCRDNSTFCGDLFCDSGENATSCAPDCQKAIGSACTNSTECNSTFCVHSFCRENSTFCGDTFCDTGETCSGDCQVAIGTNCTASSNCASGFCIHSVCRANSTFCGDNFCDSGEVCQVDCGKNITTACSTNAECKSNFCVHSVCRSASIFCGDGFCDTSETCTGDCAGGIGAACIINSDCKSKFCVHMICRANSTFCGDNFCDEDETCSSDCEKSVGESCAINSECASDFCVHEICRPSSPFCGDSFCDLGESASTCVSDCKLDDGKSCSTATQCKSNFCIHGVCRSSATFCGDGFCDTGETSLCSTDCKADIGANCTAAAECSTAFCVHGTCAAAATVCGDNYCDDGENSTSCCGDCGCDFGQLCVRAVCTKVTVKSNGVELEKQTNQRGEEFYQVSPGITLAVDLPNITSYQVLLDNELFRASIPPTGDLSLPSSLAAGIHTMSVCPKGKTLGCTEFTLSVKQPEGGLPLVPIGIAIVLLAVVGGYVALQSQKKAKPVQQTYWPYNKSAAGYPPQLPPKPK